jgi:hypothetical protein
VVANAEIHTVPKSNRTGVDGCAQSCQCFDGPTTHGGTARRARQTQNSSFPPRRDKLLDDRSLSGNSNIFVVKLARKHAHGLILLAQQLHWVDHCVTGDHGKHNTSLGNCGAHPG